MIGGRTLGTVLTLFEDPLCEGLWDDLKFVPMAPATARANADDDEIRHAARELELFFDLVAFESADLRSFLLHPTYAGMRTTDERTLADALGQLAAAVGSAGDDSPGWRQVADFLRGFGWDGSCDSTRHRSRAVSSTGIVFPEPPIASIPYLSVLRRGDTAAARSAGVRGVRWPASRNRARWRPSS